MSQPETIGIKNGNVRAPAIGFAGPNNLGQPQQTSYGQSRAAVLGQ